MLKLREESKLLWKLLKASKTQTQRRFLRMTREKSEDYSRQFLKPRIFQSVMLSNFTLLFSQILSSRDLPPEVLTKSAQPRISFRSKVKKDKLKT